MKRRRVIQLVLLLLAGAIVNVAVAWACVCWSKSGPNPAGPRMELYWAGSVPSDWRERPNLKAAFYGFGYEEHLAIWSRQPRLKSSDTSYWQLAERTGWPLRSLGVVRNVSHAAFSDPAAARRHSLDDGFAIPHWIPFVVRRGWRSLPTEILWPGFAINTIFYAAILWVMYALQLALRRGQCPACAYPVGTSPVCTECGGPVGKRPNVQTSKRPNDGLTPSA